MLINRAIFVRLLRQSNLHGRHLTTSKEPPKPPETTESKTEKPEEAPPAAEKPVTPPPPHCLKPYNPFKVEPGDELCGKSNMVCAPTATASSVKGPRPELPGKVRLGFVPEEWFQFFYPKTGVTGPYVFGLGLFTWLASKEIYVMEHEYYSGLSFAILIVAMVKKLGPKTAAYADKLIDKQEAAWEEMHKSDIELMYRQIEDEKQEQKCAEGALLLVEAKRAMIDMQLEAAYRAQMMDVYNQVINLLEYQVACANVEHRFKHKHMMYWLHDQVSKAFTFTEGDPEQEKRKADLSAMVMRINEIEKAAQIRASSSFNKN